MSYSAWSVAYATDSVEQNRCYVSLAEWRKIYEDQPQVQRIFGRIRVGEAVAFCALGEPTNMDAFGTDQEAVIIPDWVRELLYVEGDGSPVEITWLSSDSFPNATRVVLRPHDSAFYHGDARDELERELTGHGVIAEGTTIPITIQMLGGFSVSMDIIKTEPANIVLLEGDEIAFEFEGSLDLDDGGEAERAQAAAEAAQAEAAMLSSAALSSAALSSAALSSAALMPTAPPEPVGQVLGGTNRPALPDGRPWNPWR
jgi:hypothetical protein